METISNVTSGVSKMIFGEGNAQNNETQGHEPVSGQQGQGTATSPYDQGNVTPAVEKNNLDGSLGSETTAVKPISPVPNMTSSDTTAVTAAGPTPDITPPVPAKEPNHHNSTAPTTTFSHSESVPSEKSLAGTTESKQQGANVPLAEPNAAQTDAIKDSKASGEHSMAHKDAAEAIGQVHDKSAPENKSTGTAAEGGNFDASKPGAGQDAKGLVEDKESSNVTKTTSEDSAASPGKEKTSLKDKVKEKLHIKKH